MYLFLEALAAFFFLIGGGADRSPLSPFFQPYRQSALTAAISVVVWSTPRLGRDQNWVVTMSLEDGGNASSGLSPATTIVSEQSRTGIAAGFGTLEWKDFFGEFGSQSWAVNCSFQIVLFNLLNNDRLQSHFKLFVLIGRTRSAAVTFHVSF